MVLFDINAEFSNFLLSQFSEELIKRVILDPTGCGPHELSGKAVDVKLALVV